MVRQLEPYNKSPSQRGHSRSSQGSRHESLECEEPRNQAKQSFLQMWMGSKTNSMLDNKKIMFYNQCDLKNISIVLNHIKF